MLATMPKERKPSGDKKKPNRTGIAVALYIPPEIAEHLEDLILRDKRTKTVEIVQALRHHLAKKGYKTGWSDEEEEREYR